jgi:hypothetical protein
VTRGQTTEKSSLIDVLSGLQQELPSTAAASARALFVLLASKASSPARASLELVPFCNLTAGNRLVWLRVLLRFCQLPPYKSRARKAFYLAQTSYIFAYGL